MSERPSQTKQILEKLDNLTENFNEFKTDISKEISEIKTKVEMQPKIDNSRFESIAKSETVCRAEVDRQFNEQSKRIKQMEDNQTWLVRSVIAEVLGIISLFIYSFVK